MLAAESENGADHEGGGGGGGGGGRRRSHGRRESAASNAVGGGGGEEEGEGDEEGEESCQVTMRIPNDKIGRVIGRQGETINSIRQVRTVQCSTVRHKPCTRASNHHSLKWVPGGNRSQESGCRIDIENTRSGENAMRTVRIRGGLENTQHAQQLITQKASGTVAASFLVCVCVV